MGFYRLILAWMVIAAHTRGYADISDVDAGMVAVSTFFVISGYLMPLAFDANYHFPTFGQRFKYYALNRGLRIFPLCWASLLAIVATNLLQSSVLDVRFSRHRRTFRILPCWD